MRLDLQWVPRVLAGFCITFSESLDPPWSDFSEFSADFFGVFESSFGFNLGFGSQCNGLTTNPYDKCSYRVLH